MQAFAGGKTYALRGSDENASLRLYISGDGMRTWRQIDATLPPTYPTRNGIDGNDRIQFWVNLTTSEVILETASNQLWSTTDDGAHWSEVTFPNATSVDNVIGFVAGGPTTSAYPTICGIFNNPTQLYCTSDVGKTWNELASPLAADFSGADVSLLGIGPDGSVYIVNSAIRSSQKLAIYRLPLGVTQGSGWQRLGAVHDNTPDGAFCQSVCSAFPSGQEMVFWLHPSYSTSDS